MKYHPFVSSFQEIPLKLTYHSGTKGMDVMNNFYVPVLERSVKYDRVAGYFSSASFSSAAKGIAGLVKNAGKMRMITSHALTHTDAGALSGFFESEDFANELIDSFERSYREIGNLTETVTKHHVSAMCWMLKEGILEIKVVVPNTPELRSLPPDELEKFHPKFGLFQDYEGNEICFAGSINETSSAWKRNIENFSVYPSWVPGRADYIPEHKLTFSEYWTGQIDENWITVELPIAVKRSLVENYAPTDFPVEIDFTKSAKVKKLRSYQSAAVEAWIENGCIGILEMATGTGKTRTAISCIDHILEKETALVVVIVPYQHIGDQWTKELAHHDSIQVSGDWKKRIDEANLEVSLGRRHGLTLVVVKNTASRKDFVELLERIKSDYESVLLVGDEVHWLGARAFQSSLLPFANYRLGLSATPNRYFDDEGTEALRSYFGKTVYELPISKALQIRDGEGKAILCPYSYHPIVVPLSEKEYEEYRELTQKIMRISGLDSTPEIEDQIQNLRIKRAAIAKSAVSKIPALRSLIQELKKPIRQTLVYCADSAQLAEASQVLNEFGIHAQQITGDESARASQRFNYQSEREHIINNFAIGNLDILLSMECLDEGVDIPSARVGIIMASSGNPKEFIQRRGRLMRPYPDKAVAEIYDLCVLPQDPKDPLANLGLVKVELSRMQEFAADSINPEETAEIIARIKNRIENG